MTTNQRKIAGGRTTKDPTKLFERSLLIGEFLVVCFHLHILFLVVAPCCSDNELDLMGQIKA